MTSIRFSGLAKVYERDYEVLGEPAKPNTLDYRYSDLAQRRAARLIAEQIGG